MTDRLLAYARHKVHPLVWRWLGARAVEANLREELEGDLERLISDALAAEFQHYCPVTGASPDDYKNRLLKVGGLELLTGIRFLSLDLAQPFVDVMYQSEAVLTSKQLGDIQDAIRQEFAVFHPKRVRFYIPSQLPRFSQDSDKQLIAAPLGVMLAQPEPDSIEHVRLEQAASLTFYADYAAIYRQLHADHPELRAVARAESQADMQAYLEDEHLLEIFVDGTWAGVTAVFRDTNTGLGGFCVAEMVLAKAFRAQGLGSAVQLKLAAQLLSQGAESTEILFGTIGDVNIPAQRTALRAGRVDLGGHVWLPL
jgi:GNAT superfamily N-acetyltransferase